MKKLVSIILIGVLAIGLGAMSFADVANSPAGVYASLAGISATEAYELKGVDKTFGELAEENGFLEEFELATLSGKLAIIEEKVADMTLSQEDADEIIARINDCEGTPGEKLGEFYMMKFGQSGEARGNYGQGSMAQNGEMNVDAPHYGQENGTPQARFSNQAKDFSGTGSRHGQNR
jgi:hypothetical protein